MIRLAQLSDTHVLANPGDLLFGHDTTQQLGLVVEALAGQPDVVVITGDLAEDGSVEAYRTTRAIVDRLGCDVHAVPGNHDNATSLAAAFDGRVAPQRVTLSQRWTMLLVDSSVPGEAHGHVDANTLAALDDELSRTANNALVCMHHPPVSPCNFDYCVITNAADVVDVITRHRCVRAVLSGHHHRAFETTYPTSDVRFLGAPSTFRQLEHGGSPHFTETAEPSAARMLELHDDGTITTELVSVPA